ncbi:putative fatty acyl-CoA reductase CG5065 isoform X2 [Anoplolepis gracilipes]|uniref:putative fatty acyl-CoA reductase CG5065 isoform X2 n=1 Tax=Anoplolepis gracilipes TaxID=354296 RepID=UPI003BA28D41
MDKNNKIEMHKTPIQKFYAGQSILITGSTGFLGKILVEKLLRSCPDISTMYLLIRSKKNKCPESRLNDIFENPLYNRLNKEVPNFRKKVVPLIIDLNAEDLGLSENDKNMLMRKVSIVFHLAATVRFEEKMKTAITINVIATNIILNIAKHMPNLKSFIHVSTLYANCHVKHIEERFYTYPINHKNLITLTRALPENVIEEYLDKIASSWPNTYTFTKAIAETLFREESGDLPIGIFRPAIVMPTAREPIVGWGENLYGPVGSTLSILLGFTRIQWCDPNIPANLVPVDFTVNALIASAWDVSNQCRRGKDMLIYNYISANALTWIEYINKILYINQKYPLKDSMWFPFIILISREMPYKICTWFCHLLPAFLVDTVRICMGRRPRMWKLYNKIHKAVKSIAHFSTNTWNYTDDNVQIMWNCLNEKDQQLFPFNVKELDWTKYLTDFHKGIRLYLLKEDDSNLEISRTYYKSIFRRSSRRSSQSRCVAVLVDMNATRNLVGI